MKKPLINFKKARIIEIASIVLMLILSGLTVLLELNKAFLTASIVGGLTVYVVTASLFDRCPSLRQKSGSCVAFAGRLLSPMRRAVGGGRTSHADNGNCLRQGESHAVRGGEAPRRIP